MDDDLDALERELQRDLETVRKYKELVARRAAAASGNQDPPPLAPAQPGRRHPARRKATRGTSLIGLVEALLDDDWHPVRFYVQRAQAMNSKASRAAVATALRRLHEYGRAEKGGNAEDGLRYRRAKKNETP